MSVYTKVQTSTESATPIFMVVVADDAGEDGVVPPSHGIVCDGMYEYVADWLVETLGTTEFPSPPVKETKE